MPAKYLNCLVILSFYLFYTVSCKKMVDIPPPVNSITTSQVFSTNKQAQSAMAAVYTEMINSGSLDRFCNGALSIYTGASADDLLFFSQTVDSWVQVQNNNLTSVNTLLSPYYWSSAYSLIYKSNAIIEGLRSSIGVQDNLKQELTGEALFIRAFCHFYLVNLFGDIPLVITTNYNQTSLLSRSSKDNVYQQIVADLLQAKGLLRDDYSMGNGEKVIPNKWVATALLSRVYLYMKDWENAEVQANSIIGNTSRFSLATVPDSVFLVNCTEAIWQLKQNNSSGSFSATPEAKRIIPINATTQPFVYLRQELLNSFEAGDKRKVKWVDSTKYPSGSAGVVYYYPGKYKDGPSAVPNGTYKEYYMVFRLAEQYLVRAEARVKQNNLNGAIADISMIRTRAGLPSLPNTLTQPQVLAAIEQENRIEFFAEWGHRWLDLKRWGRADIVLGAVKGSNWQTTDQLYPIPQYDLSTDPNLTQNPGY